MAGQLAIRATGVVGKNLYLCIYIYIYIYVYVHTSTKGNNFAFAPLIESRNLLRKASRINVAMVLQHGRGAVGVAPKTQVAHHIKLRLD